MANVKIVDNRSTSKAINNNVYETSSKKPKNNSNDLKNVVDEYLEILISKQEIKKNLIREEVKSMKKVTKFKDKFNDELDMDLNRQKKKKIKKKPIPVEVKEEKVVETTESAVNSEDEELSPELEKFANMIIDGMVEKFVTREEIKYLVEKTIQGMIVKNVNIKTEE